MKKVLFLLMFPVLCFGQGAKDSIEQLEVPVYKIFPTENIATLLKLNTRNGKIWQVHFTVSEDSFKGEIPLNKSALVFPESEINGRFTLYPTKNMYNFILIDQIVGSTWQVQWNNERDKRFITEIF